MPPHASPKNLTLRCICRSNHSASVFDLAGLILYGGSTDGKGPERCTEVREYMTSTFLPAIEAIVLERNAAIHSTTLKTDEPRADITQFGAIPDDEKDDTAAIQHVLGSCVHEGRCVCRPGFSRSSCRSTTMDRHVPGNPHSLHPARRGRCRLDAAIRPRCCIQHAQEGGGAVQRAGRANRTRARGH